MWLERGKVALIIDKCPRRSSCSQSYQMWMFFIFHQTQQATHNHVIDDEVPFRADVFDAIIMLCASRSDVSSTTIENFLYHCGFSLLQATRSEEEEEGEKEEEQEGENANDDDNLLDRLSAIIDNVMGDWVSCDEDALTTSELSDTQLAQDEAKDDSTDDEQDDILI